jgi:CRISPR-associated endoribonuclease Cas6
LRLLLKLIPKKSYAYVNDYHYHLQAAIYSLIREGGLPDVHEKKGYKFFCFSNIFPYGGGFERGVERNLLISSPSNELIEAIQRASLLRFRSRVPFLIGDQRFDFVRVNDPFELHLLGSEVTVRSATPIIVRIPRDRYEDYGIKPRMEYEYVFWRETIPLEAFVKQLRDSMAKKWKEYWSENGRITLEAESDLLPPITNCRLVKIVSKPITLKQEKQMVIGSLWELGFMLATNRQRDFLTFSIDCGFGERNSLGFGFVNSKQGSAAY